MEDNDLPKTDAPLHGGAPTIRHSLSGKPSGEVCLTRCQMIVATEPMSSSWLALAANPWDTLRNSRTKQLIERLPVQGIRADYERAGQHWPKVLLSRRFPQSGEKKVPLSFPW